MKPHLYTKLPYNNYIRLIRLLPGNDGTDIHCEIFNEAMSVYTGNYAALSYVWGKPEYTHKILVGENCLAITPNLHAALLRLRDSTAAKKLWVDAICINQADDEERAAQVESMAQIYAFADHVLVWLGPQAGDSDAAFHTIESAAGRAGDLETSYSAAAHVDNIKGENLNLPIPEATALNSLLKRPYFGRIWILQELAAARKSVILCGPQEMDGTVFCKGIRELKSTFPNIAGLVDSLTHLIMHWPENTRIFMGSARLSILPLRTLVGMFHDQDATDRRDKIFALLGMSSEDSLEIRVDYKTTWKLLFRDLIRSIVGQKPDILTWEGSEMALIQGYGCVLGKVTEITPATAINQYDTICVTSKHFRGHGGQAVEWHASLTIPAMVKPILVGDVVCLLEGSLYPTIIRLRNDGNPFRAFFSVINLSVPTPERVFIASPYSASITWSDLLACISSFNRTFVLSWHWGFEGALQGRRQWRRDRIPTTHPDLNVDPFNQIPKERYDFVRLGDIALVYDDLEDLHTLRKVLQGMSTITTGTMNGPSEIQSFLQLLDHWQVYTRLKKELELVYWELWKIHSRRQWQTTFEDLISLYAEEGNMQYGLFEVAKLMSDYTFTLPSRTISPLSHKSRSVSTQLSGMLHDKLSSHDWASFPWDIQREQDMTGPGPLRAMLKKFLQNVKLPQRILLKRSRELNIKQHSGPASLFPSSIAEILKSEDPIAYAQLNVVEKHSNNVHRLLVLLKPKNTTDTNTIYLALRAIAGEFQINGGWLGLQPFDVLKLLFGDPPVNDAITNESFAHFTHLAHQYNDDCVVKFLHQWYCPLSLISA